MERKEQSTQTEVPSSGEPNQPMVPKDCYNFIASLVSDTNVLLISEPKVVVGRSSTSTQIDFPVSTSKLISHQHFTIEYIDGEFWSVCLSKNGIYINDVFLPTGANPYMLPKSCTIRFPATDIKIFFYNLIGCTPHIGMLMDRAMLSAVVSNLAAQTMSEDNLSIRFSNKHNANNLEGHIVSSLVMSKLLQLVPIRELPSERIDPKLDDASESMVGGDMQQTATETALPDNTKPPFSYAQLIVQAITASPLQQLTLSEIYTFLKDKYPNFRSKPSGGWQNSIRHSLSLNKFFVKVPRTFAASGKGNCWRIDSTTYSQTMANRSTKR